MSENVILRADGWWYDALTGERIGRARLGNENVEPDNELSETKMQGKRVFPDESGSFQLEPGDYGKLPQGYWIGCTPNGLPSNLKSHEVTEHDDGTITVSPSILTSKWDGKQWHGFLEHGVWREV